MDTGNIKEKLKIKLKEIFQLEDLDLDFGIYRIMKYKKEEIGKFIKKDLIEETKTQLNLLSEEERKNKEKELEELKSKLIELGVKDYQNNEKYQQKLKEIENIKVSEDLERDIYKHILNFFSRYYDNGDFITQRRYGKDNKYLIPYNGEEVKLYWANYDQYYVKTTEFFKKYSFKVQDLEVNFRVVEAEEEKSNIKSQEKKFFLLNERGIELDNNILNIYFDYRGLTEKEKIKYGTRNVQAKINQEICKEITSFIEKEHKKNQKLLLLIQKQIQDEKSIIEKKLYHYTRRNTSDYFIHKDLKKFLEQELDFYIKSEVVNIEDVNKLDVSELQKYSLKIKVIKNIADKIIEFVSHIENFQKKLWEKKKFVLRTEYVITTDRIFSLCHSERSKESLKYFFDEIWNNEEQKKEWKNLGFEIPVLPLRETKFRNNLKLPIDTRYFSQEFKEKLLEKLTENADLDDLLDGLLIKSENWQALNLLLGKYKEKVQTIYIDPPFNKEKDADYLYNVKYKDASWITLIENRLQLAKGILNSEGSIFVRCDYNGNMLVRLLMNEIFGKENFRNEIIINRTLGKKKTGESLPLDKDSIFLFSKNLGAILNAIEKPLEKAEIINYIIQYLNKKKLLNNNLKDELLNILWVRLDHRPGERLTSKERMVFGKIFSPPKGRHWIKSQEKLDKLEEEGKLRLKCTNCNYVHYTGEWTKCPECKKDTPIIEVFLDTGPISESWLDIGGYSQTWKFQTENSEPLLRRVVEFTSSSKSDIIMDFFLGIGTTVAVAHKLNRKWVGVEMGEHFYSFKPEFGALSGVLVRMKEVLAGKGNHEPCGITREVNWQGGGFFKYQILEQYEDALENIEFKKPQQEIKFDDYLLRYILDFETKDSQTFLNIDNMEDPFNYKLKIIEEYQPKEVNVDLQETYNYLIGLKVNKIKFLKNQEDNNRQYLFITGERKNNKVLVIWRNRKKLDPEKDRDFVKRYFELKDFNEIHINGDSVLSHQNIIIIEAEFKKLLFPMQV